MPLRVGLIYNEPVPGRYAQMGEADAIADVLDAVSAVHKALGEMRHTVTLLPLVPPLEKAREQINGLDVDVFFNLFEGFAGSPQTEAQVTSMLAVSGKPYTGSNPATLALALEKGKAKELLMSAGVATPRYQVLDKSSVKNFNLSFPCIVKPMAEDASHGVTQDSVVADIEALERQVERVCRSYGGAALVEEFIDGRELSATIMGNRKPIVLSISEIVFTLPPGLPRILTFGAKWLPQDIYFDHTDPVCPAQIDRGLWQHVAETSLAAYRLLGCRGYARVDMRIGEAGRAHVLEVNPNPDISLTSGAVRQAAAIGLTYAQFVDKILKLALDEE